MRDRERVVRVVDKAPIAQTVGIPKLGFDCHWNRNGDDLFSVVGRDDPDLAEVVVVSLADIVALPAR